MAGRKENRIIPLLWCAQHRLVVVELGMQGMNSRLPSLPEDRDQDVGRCLPEASPPGLLELDSVECTADLPGKLGPGLRHQSR